MTSHTTPSTAATTVTGASPDAVPDSRAVAAADAAVTPADGDAPVTSPPPDLLRQYAWRVLRQNWTGASTVPSLGLYPHQWSWDSAFIAIGLRHLSAARARRELETLFTAQWADGRVPHIVFNPDVPLGAYFPSPDFWRSSTAGARVGAPGTVETSGLIQPPVHALAAWLVHLADPTGSARRGFLSRMYPRLVAWQRYLTDHRDLGGRGLVSIVHPWESGMDNSPCWDEPLSRIVPARADTFRRADLDHGDACDRPTDLDYGRYVRLAADYRDHGYHDASAPHRFAVEDPGVNALLIASERALAHIATAIGADPEPHRERVTDLTDALVERLWDAENGIFLCHDVRGGGPIRELSCSGLLPLIVPGLPPEVSAALLRTVTGPHFGLGSTTRMVPSYDLLGAAFDPSRYWRGPAWFNVNWLIERGLREYGEHALAEDLRACVLASAVSSDFAEYLDPYTGRARGTRQFGWTAALTVDLLGAVRPPEPVPHEPTMRRASDPPRRPGRAPAGGGRAGGPGGHAGHGPGGHAGDRARPTGPTGRPDPGPDTGPAEPPGGPGRIGLSDPSPVGPAAAADSGTGVEGPGTQDGTTGEGVGRSLGDRPSRSGHRDTPAVEPPVDVPGTTAAARAAQREGTLR
ncbi:amylo-alpha-1,6-glucosidase [Streptomyces alkaliphilus]|uniref:amylo-alpha-1,6-glucosidase n=1 Tax=Streptomyces alkaliphilus TaxID=1472722 RepID=UPI003899F8CA